MIAFPATKAELRAAALARRAELGSNHARRRRRGAPPVGFTPSYPAARSLPLFWPMRDEIDPRGLIDARPRSRRKRCHAGGGEAPHVLPPLRRRGVPGAGRIRHEPSACRPAGGRPRLHRGAARRLRPARRTHRLRRRALRSRRSPTSIARDRAFELAGIAFAAQEVEQVPAGAARRSSAAHRDRARADRGRLPAAAGMEPTA